MNFLDKNFQFSEGTQDEQRYKSYSSLGNTVMLTNKTL